MCIFTEVYLRRAGRTRSLRTARCMALRVSPHSVETAVVRRARGNAERSLCKLCSLVVGMPGLKSLDLSCNKVPCYLANGGCTLQSTQPLNPYYCAGRIVCA